MLVAIVAWGSYALIVALEEGLSEWLTKRVLQKGQLADSEDDEVEGCGGRVVEDLGEEPKELNRYVHLRSRYRRNRCQARRQYGMDPGYTWVFLGFAHTLYSREPADGFATRVRVTCTHVFADG